MSNGMISTGEPTVELWEASPPQSEIRFTMRHIVLLEIAGVVRRWHAVLGIDRDRPERSAVEVVIDAGSLETASRERDDHLRSAEFLDVASFPEIRFQSTEVRPSTDGDFVVVGDLKVKDVIREVVLAGRRERAGGPDGELVITARTTVDRQDVHLHWNQDLARGGVVVGDLVGLEIRMRARPFQEGPRAAAEPW